MIRMQKIEAETKNIINDFIDSEDHPDYHGAIKAIAQNLDSSKLKETYLLKHPEKRPGVEVGFINLEAMARSLITRVISQEYLDTYRNKDFKAAIIPITQEALLDALRRGDIGLSRK